MKPKASVLIATCLLGVAGLLIPPRSFAQGAGGAQGGPPPDTFTTEIPGVVEGGIKVEVVKEGMANTEGATAAPDGSLLVTERGANRITKIDKNDAISTYLEDTSAANSVALDPKGRAIGAQWMPPQIGVLGPSKSTLADKFEGHGFGRPNDLVISKKGGIYFTDDLGIPAQGVKPAVYYIKPDGSILKMADDINRPNGLELSPDEKVLYVDDTNSDALRAFDVLADGSTTNERIFAKITEGLRKSNSGDMMMSGSDGVTIDADGRLYVATNAGIQVFSPAGQHLGTIPVPRAPANLAFAGADKKTLYILGHNGVFKVRMLAGGYQGRSK